MCIIWGISTFYMHLCSLSPTYRVRCAQRKGISSIFKKEHQFVMFIFGNLCKSLHVSRYFSLSRHTGSLQNPPHGVAANVTGRFTARTFHSRKLAVVFEERKNKLCTCKPYNLECHYACIYGFNLFLVLCQPPV